MANEDVRLATAERPGAGPPIVLMHGLGTSSRSMASLAARLGGFRVISMDLRGHGESTTGPFSWAGAVSDVAAVVAAFGLDRPYLVGHSLGGMVALQYALAGGPVAGVVNIDGWGPGVASRFLGEDPVVVQDRLDRIAGGALPSRLARVASARTRQGREGTSAQVLAVLHGADVVAWHRDAPCPSLAFCTTASGSRLLGREMRRMQAAHRAGLRRDLGSLPPTVTVVEVDAGHFVHTSHPDLVAAAIEEFCG